MTVTGGRSTANQLMVEAAVGVQRRYIELRDLDKSDEEIEAELGVKNSAEYKAMYEVHKSNPGMLEAWFEDWIAGEPTASPVPGRCSTYMAKINKTERLAAKRKHSNAGQAGPMPTFTPAEIPARASLATIDELRIELARWRGKSKAAYNLITNEDFIVKLEQFIDSAVEVVTVVRKIMDLLDMDKEGDDDTK